MTTSLPNWPKCNDVSYYRGYTLIQDNRDDSFDIFDMHMERIDTADTKDAAHKVIDDWHNAR